MSTTGQQETTEPPPEAISMEVTPEERVYAFYRATQAMEGAGSRWKARAELGMSDSDLAEHVEYELGLFGGFHGENGLSVIYKGLGLKVWVGRPSAKTDGPTTTYSGAASVAMARELYGVMKPGDTQMSFL